MARQEGSRSGRCQGCNHLERVRSSGRGLGCRRRKSTMHQRTTLCTAGSGPASTTALSVAIWPSLALASVPATAGC
jgi:hypothetical protein